MNMLRTSCGYSDALSVFTFLIGFAIYEGNIQYMSPLINM